MEDRRWDETASWDARQVRRSQAERPRAEEPPRKRRRRKRMNPFLYLLLVLLTSAALACIGWMLGSDLCAFNKEYQETTVQITADDDMGSIAKKLKEADLIRYPWFFRLFAQISHAQDKIGIGTYELDTDMDYHALITAMHNSSGSMNTDTVRVTIPEGYTVSQTIALLAKNGVNTVSALTDAAKTADFDYDYIDNNSEDISRLEGYLFPDTYDFYLNEKPANALNRLLRNFNSKLDDDLLNNAKQRGYSLKDVITIASLIEKETDGTDQTRIASVIYNRLEGSGDKGGTYGMLQIDAALLYALPDHSGGITESDKKVDSPYNLYKKAGLPPTPIANPGMASIQAALEPETTDYYYYALGRDGTHHFFKTFKEHQNFVNSDEYGG